MRGSSGCRRSDGCVVRLMCCMRVVVLVLGGCSSVETMPAYLQVASIPQPDPWATAVTLAPVEQQSVPQKAAGPIREYPEKSRKLVELLPKGGGYKKVGKPYEIRGVRYVPRHDPDYAETGIASWYGDNFHGKATANGEVYNMRALTAAHRTLPLPSLASVTNIRTGKKVIVRINDRGPFRKGRIIDVSAQVAEILGFSKHGVAQVRVQYLGPAPLGGDDSREKSHLASLAR